MLPFGVTIAATVPQGSEIPEGLMNNPVLYYITIYSTGNGVAHFARDWKKSRQNHKTESTVT